MRSSVGSESGVPIDLHICGQWTVKSILGFFKKRCDSEIFCPSGFLRYSLILSIGSRWKKRVALALIVALFAPARVDDRVTPRVDEHTDDTAALWRVGGYGHGYNVRDDGDDSTS